MTMCRAIAVILLTLVIVAACTPAKLVGEPLPGAIAPDFTLTDGPTGETVTLSTLRGRVVLLTFLFTTCYETCPLTAEIIRGARDRLGDSAKSVAFVAVSVDPKGDTPTTTRRFVEDHQLQSSLRYLIGPQSVLAPVWKNYGIAQGPSAAGVFHTDVIYLIDKRARGRVLLHSDTTPEVLANDLSILARER